MDALATMPTLADLARTHAWKPCRAPVAATRIRRVQLDKGGYTRRSGVYFGTGLPLYAVELEGADGNTLTGYVRAASYCELRTAVRRLYPAAKQR